MCARARALVHSHLFWTEALAPITRSPRAETGTCCNCSPLCRQRHPWGINRYRVDSADRQRGFGTGPKAKVRQDSEFRSKRLLNCCENALDESASKRPSAHESKPLFVREVSYFYIDNLKYFNTFHSVCVCVLLVIYFLSCD